MRIQFGFGHAHHRAIAGTHHVAKDLIVGAVFFHDEHHVPNAGGQRLELRADGASIQTVCSRLSGGIVLKREELSTDEWLHALGETLAVQARNSQTTRQALERLLNR